MLEITSTNNAKIKFLLQLQKKSAVRKKEELFVIEGKRELQLALQNNFQIQSIYYYPELFSENDITKLLLSNTVETIQISKNVFEKLAYRNSTEGVIGVAKMKSHSLLNLQLSQNPFILITESVEKPGNLGAMLRSLDGAGADALIMLNPVVDLYNPNLIRSSLGTVFSNQIAYANITELQDFLQQHNIHLYTATLQNSHPYYLQNYKTATAIAVGSESKGLSNEIREISNQAIYIPMNGQADSLNVSVSAAILLYEVVKQRNL